MTAPKKPSGQDNRIRRRQEAEQARKNEEKRKGGRKALPKLALRQAALKLKGAARVTKLHKAEVNEAQARAYENAVLLANALRGGT